MTTEYDVEEWATGTTRGRRVFNYNYRMLGTEIKGWRLTKVVTAEESPEGTERVYLWQNKASPEREMVRVSITERHNWRLAQEGLRKHLDQCSRPNIPKGTKKLAEIGDVNFVGRAPETNITAATAFARGNVHVWVSSVGEKNVDVSEFAETVDRALSAPPAKTTIARGTVRVHAPRTITLTANKAAVVIEKLPEAGPGGEWLKIIVPDGELSRKGDALMYESPEDGEKAVESFEAPLK